MIDGIGTSITFARGSDGRVILKINDANNANINNVANVKGTAELKFGVTGDEDVTQYLFTHEGDTDNNVTLQNVDGNHYNFEGENFNIDAEGGNAQRTIQMNTAASNLDLSATGGSQYVYMTEDSHDNKVKLGYGNDNYIDEGKFNSVDDIGGDNRFETTKKAHGSVITAGAGNDTFVIGGNYGVIDGRDGSNNFTAVGMFGETEESSYRNIIMGGAGDDSLTDNGGYNIFFGGGGSNTYNVSGKNGIAQLGSGSDGEAIFGSSSDHSYAFTTEELTTNAGVTYNIYDIMNKYDWTLYEFLNVYSQVSGEDTRSLGSQDVIDADTMKKLETYFQNNLQKTE